MRDKGEEEKVEEEYQKMSLKSISCLLKQGNPNTEKRQE